jgi:Tol biopolymer transport system component
MRLPLVSALVLVVIGSIAVGAAAPGGNIAPLGALVFVVQQTDAYGYADTTKPPHIYRMRTDGTGLTRLARNASSPAASPDGSRLAFVRDADIWVMDSSGRNQRRILKSKRGTFTPTWSADGATVFFLQEDGIYRMRADGKVVRRVVKATCLDDLSASPKGRDLAYVEWPSDSSPNECDGAPPSLRVSDLSGRNVRFPGGRWAESPAWSPDGTLLAFNSFDAVNGPPFGIYIVGTGQERRLTSRTGSPTWSPRGTHIAFADGDLWIIRRDGKGLSRVKHLPKLDLSDPVWLPVADG